MAKLREASEREILRFAHVYGELGYTSLVRDAETVRAAGGILEGDPVEWIRLHGHTVALCLELSDAIQASDTGHAGDIINGDLLKPGVMQLGKHYADGRVFEQSAAAGAALVTEKDVLKTETLNTAVARLGWLDRARALRRDIINGNIERIFCQIKVMEDGSERSYFGYNATIEAVYWHLANLVDGGTVKRCAAKDCGAVFIQTHGHQRFCPPRWKQRESPCAPPRATAQPRSPAAL